jgi:hypothetical protein
LAPKRHDDDVEQHAHPGPRQDILASLPTDWPLMRLGLRMCAWVNMQTKYYLMGVELPNESRVFELCLQIAHRRMGTLFVCGQDCAIWLDAALPYVFNSLSPSFAQLAKLI